MTGFVVVFTEIKQADVNFFLKTFLWRISEFPYKMTMCDFGFLIIVERGESFGG